MYSSNYCVYVITLFRVILSRYRRGKKKPFPGLLDVAVGAQNNSPTFFRRLQNQPKPKFTLTPLTRSGLLPRGAYPISPTGDAATTQHTISDFYRQFHCKVWPIIRPSKFIMHQHYHGAAAFVMVAANHFFRDSSI